MKRKIEWFSFFHPRSNVVYKIRILLNIGRQNKTELSKLCKPSGHGKKEVLHWEYENVLVNRDVHSQGIFMFL